MSDILVKVEGVQKKLCRSLKRSLWYGAQDIGSELLGRPRAGLRVDEFWAVKDVSFELARGQCLGLVGRNGAGKTTLLRLISGLIRPDGGRIEVRGRVGALIALGAGFNPLLSGRENIYVNASILGLSKRQTEAKLDEIIDFAELADFIDAPVQSYSSGMHVRLGFAIASAVEPDVLVLDEVLAVGDAAFRHKCYHRLGKMMENAAVILVSHSMEYVAAACTSVMMLRRGEVAFRGSVGDGIAAYNAENAGRAQDALGAPLEVTYRPITRAHVRILSPIVAYGGTLMVEVEIDSDVDLDDVVFSFVAINFADQPVMCWHTGRRPDRVGLRRGSQVLRFSVSPLLLHDGRYACNFNATRRGSIEHFIWFVRAGQFEVTSALRPVGNIPYLVDTSSCELVMTDAPGAHSSTSTESR